MIDPQASLRRSIDRNMTNHPPTKLTQSVMEAVRGEYHRAATAIAQCPPGRESALAQTKLEESLMWAMAALARDDYDRRQASNAEKVASKHIQQQDDVVELEGRSVGRGGVHPVGG